MTTLVVSVRASCLAHRPRSHPPQVLTIHHQRADNPQDDEEICGDPYKTLFVGRIPHEVTEKELLREFDVYGPIDRIRLVTDPESGESRGYAFIVYERERDMKAAYKDADGLKMKGRRLLIDVERGRTVRGWKPRRLGGGLGGRVKKLKGEHTIHLLWRPAPGRRADWPCPHRWCPRSGTERLPASVHGRRRPARVRRPRRLRRTGLLRAPRRPRRLHGRRRRPRRIRESKGHWLSFADSLRAALTS